MEARLMHVTPNRCTACRNCELACAFSHSLGNKPTKSRVTAVQDPESRDGHNQLVICMQCETASCVAACPSNALWRNPATGAIYHKSDRCIRCASCVAACPFGNMKWETLTSFPVKCDLCDGAPVCVRFCPTNAIEYR